MLAESQRRMLTPAATARIDARLPADAIFWTDGVVIEHRFVATEPDGPVRRGPRRRRGPRCVGQIVGQTKTSLSLTLR